MNEDSEPVSREDAIADAMRGALTRGIANEASPSITWTSVLSRARRAVLLRRAFALSACIVVILGVTAIAFAATSGDARRGVSVIGSTTTTRTTPVTLSGCTHKPVKRLSWVRGLGLPTPDGPSIDFLHSGGLTPVVDGRGNRAHGGRGFVQRRGPDGSVTLTLGRNASVGLSGFGDFDGDGLGDLLIEAIGEDGMYRNYIVPGTVGTGTYDPASVGVRIDQPRDFVGEPASVGDQNGDGADDVSFGRRLYSGRQLAALPSGGTLPAPFRTLSSDYIGLLQLDANGPPSFVLPGAFSLEVFDARSDRLLLDVGSPKTTLAEALQNGNGTSGWLVNGAHIVQFEYDTRGGDFLWRWNLDAPCGT
jgi:hypothetical protein